MFHTECKLVSRRTTNVRTTHFVEVRRREHTMLLISKNKINFMAAKKKAKAKKPAKRKAVKKTVKKSAKRRV